MSLLSTRVSSTLEAVELLNRYYYRQITLDLIVSFLTTEGTSLVPYLFHAGFFLYLVSLWCLSSCWGIIMLPPSPDPWQVRMELYAINIILKIENKDQITRNAM